MRKKAWMTRTRLTMTAVLYTDYLGNMLSVRTMSAMAAWEGLEVVSVPQVVDAIMPFAIFGVGTLGSPGSDCGDTVSKHQYLG